MSATTAWQLRRLNTMGAAEIGWRVRQFAWILLERCGIGLARGVNAGTGNAGSAWVSPLPAAFNVTLYAEAADRILAGEWEVFSLTKCPLGFPPRWNRDPKTGVEAPLDFGKGIDYRNERIVGDIKYLWEPNRHLELVTLAQAWHLTREPRYAEGARLLLSSWLEQCPYPLGANWTSSLELGVRLVNWACAWQLLGGEASPLFAGAESQVFRQRWLRAVYQHCHFISGYLSRHSSANNHLFGELMGLFVASVTWPLWPQSVRWRERAQRELEAEAIEQNAADGTNREQAFWYHHEVADMMLLCLLFGQANGIVFSRQFQKRLESMLEFIAAVMDAGGHVPMVGDADEALMVRLSREPGFCPYQSLLATGAVLFGRGDFKFKAGGADDKTRWLLGNDAVHRFDALVARAAEPRRAFADGGYWILGDHFGTPEEVKLVADAGPLGYLSIAAHGHADALAFTLSVSGREILIDPGTYAYHTQKPWRDYFRGTSAHNTVRIDGLDQSLAGGNFLWLKHARAACERFESTPEHDEWIATHDGYRRLPDPVTHRRTIHFDKKSGLVRILDRLECRKTHRIELFWHAATACDVKHEDGAVTFLNDGVTLSMTMEEPAWRPQLISGQEDPPLGWISRRFDQKTPSTTVVWCGDIRGTTQLLTLIRIRISNPL
jgi:hypothetical protein